MAQVGLGLVGLGTVGTGVVKIISDRRAAIAQRIGAEIRFVQYASRRKMARPAVGIRADQVQTDYRKLLSDPKIDIIVELVGGYEPARTIILSALKHGKHVVTANKAVLAKYWGEIFQTAQKYKKLVYFEAAVGGGIPVIQGLNEGLAANRIEKIFGILNGTTNYILTQMSENGISFGDALKQAQVAGFAEADPTFDIEGIDSAHKLAVLSSIAFGGWIKISDVYCEGISQLNLMDIKMAREEFGYGLKLLGIAREKNGACEVRVHPTFLPAGHPFLSVKNEYNAVFIEGDSTGDVMFYGRGAGQMAAASAVVSDIIFLARHVAEGTAGKHPYVTFNENRTLKILPKDNFESKYYLRFTTLDRPGVLAKITGILGSSGVSIASVYQPAAEEKSKKDIPASILITTHLAYEGKILRAIDKINRLPQVKARTVLIRIEE